MQNDGNFTGKQPGRKQKKPRPKGTKRLFVLPPNFTGRSLCQPRRYGRNSDTLSL